MILSVGLANLVTFLSYPFLATLYDLSFFGYLGVTNAYALIMSSVYSLKFDYFVLNSKNDIHALRHLISGITICIIGFILSIFILLFISLFFNFFSIQKLHILGLTFLFAIYNVLSFYLIFRNKILLLNCIKVAKSMLILLFQLFLYFVDFVNNGLVTGLLSGLLLINISLFIIVRPDIKRYALRCRASSINIFGKVGKTILARLKDIKYQIPQTSLNSIVSNSLIIFIEILFGKTVTGGVVIAEKLIRMPIGLVIETIKPLLVTDFSKLPAKVALGKLTNYILCSILLSCSMVITILFLSNLALMDDITIWQKIEKFVLPLSFFSMAILLTFTTTCYLYSKNKSKELFKIELWKFVLFLSVFATFYFSKLQNLLIFYIAISLSIALPVAYFLIKEHKKRYGNEST